MVGTLLGGPICDAFGRKPSIILCGLLFTLGGALLAGAHSFGTLLLGRIVEGIAIGWSGFCVAVYVAEVSPQRWRGVLVAVNELALCTGCLFAFLCGWLLHDNWRWMFGASIPSAVLLCIGTCNRCCHDADCAPEHARFACLLVCTV